MSGKNRHGQRRPDTVGGDQCLEGGLLVARQKSVESLGVLTNVVVDVQEGR